MSVEHPVIPNELLQIETTGEGHSAIFYTDEGKRKAALVVAGNVVSAALSALVEDGAGEFEVYRQG